MGRDDSAALAALPMYDWPEIQSINDRLWTAVVEAASSRGLKPPSALTRGVAPMDIWTDPNLFLAQTCGLPYVRHLRPKTQIVATPIYEADGCKGPYYRSFIVVRGDSEVRDLSELKGQRAAINDCGSQSGYNAFRAALSIAAEPGQPFFGSVHISGTHRNSIIMVAEGEADVASIDAVAWSLARRHEHRAFARVRVLAETRLTAGLPLITSGSRSPETVAAMQASLEDACGALSAAERDDLLLAGFEPLTDADYETIADMDQAFAPVIFKATEQDT